MTDFSHILFSVHFLVWKVIKIVEVLVLSKEGIKSFVQEIEIL